MFFASILLASMASVNLGMGIYEILQPEFAPAFVALNFATALFCTLMTLVLATIRKG